MVDVKASASTQGNVNQNMYRVGEFVYLDSKGAHPYLIRRIEEFSKNQNGVNDVRVTIVYRRRDISTAILRVADSAERHWPDYLVYDETTGQERATEKQKVVVNENGEIDITSVPIEPPTNGQDMKKENGTAPRKERKEKPEKLSESKDDEEETLEKEEPKEEEEKEEETEEKKDEMQPFDWGVGGLPFDANMLSEEDRYKLRQREVFLSRKEERLNVSHIRGKCSINLLCDVETSEDYLSREDAYFYSLVYDNDKLSMLADKGAIRVGPQYQAVLPGEEIPVKAEADVKEETMETDENKENGDLMIDEEDMIKKEIEEEDEMCREHQVYCADNGLSNNDIDRYLIHVRAVGVFARVIDPNSAIKYPSAQMIAALASKDSTIFYAYGLLHKAGYNIALAQDFLVPPANKNKIPTDIDDNMGFNTLTIGGPLLVRDQLEEYSAPDSVLFEEGIDKIGKDFSEIRNQLLQWKSLASIVEYYYLFKTTSRYIDGRKKRNAIEKEGRLLQVYVPACAETTAYLTGAFNTTEEKVTNEHGCNGCSTKAAINWYKWGNRGDDAILCQDCWKFWRHYGGLQVRNKLDHFDTNIAADPDVAQELLKSLSYATPSCSKTGKDPKRYGANSYTMYTVVSASDLNQSSAANAANAKQKGHINMKTNLFTKVIRRAIPKTVLSVKKCGRNPFINLNMTRINNYVIQMDQTKICQVMKAIAAPKVNVPATTFQQLVSDLMTQFSSSSNKRPASASLEGQPPAKKAPALSYLPYLVEENLQGSGVYTFLSGPVYRQRRRQQINRNLARRLGRRPLHNNSDLFLSLVSSCEPVVNSSEQFSHAPSIHIL